MHSGQFAILKNKAASPDCETVELKNGWWLSRHKKVPVLHNRDTGVLLIGYVWQTLEGRPSPGEAILRITDTEELLRQEESWCGRYVLIMNDKVYTDASGLFGVFCCEKGVSSDLSVLRQELDLKKSSWTPDDIMRWYPGPDTPYAGISRLLPSQVYDLDSGEISFRNILAASVPVYEDREALTEAFISQFCTSLQNLEKEFEGRKLLLALTGGYDSRTLLALSVRSGIDFECYTLEHDNMPLGDIEYPPKICGITGSRYCYYSREQGRYSKEREEQYLEHLQWMQREQDRTFYAYDQYQELVRKFGPVVLLRSGVWEIAQEYDRRAVGEKADVEDVLNYYELPLKSEEADAFRNYFKWCSEHPLPLTDTNRYFWEQRCGSWIAESEHGFDIYGDIISLQPVNCRMLITMLLQFPKEERMVKQHQAVITQSICPGLKDIPYGKNENYTRSRLRKMKNALNKACRRVKRIGIRRTVALYGRILSDRRITARSGSGRSERN